MVFLPKHSLSRLPDADCVVTMILNHRLRASCPVSHRRMVGPTDVELQLSPAREANAFCDDRLALVLRPSRRHRYRYRAFCSCRRVLFVTRPRARLFHSSGLHDAVACMAKLRTFRRAGLWPFHRPAARHETTRVWSYSSGQRGPATCLHELPILGSHPGCRKLDPHTLYRGSSAECEMPILLH